MAAPRACCVAAIVLPACVGGRRRRPARQCSTGRDDEPVHAGSPAADADDPDNELDADGHDTTTSSSDSGLNGTSAIAIAIGALVVLGGISFFIWRDARKRAPVRRAAAAIAGDGRARAGSKARPKPRKLSPAERKRRKRGRAR